MSGKAQICRHCESSGEGKYCNSCGQSFQVKRLSLQSILHEAFHFFTHLDHGFPFTLKKLITSPGTMQKEYVEGYRSKYQKPFSMFFLCATVMALVLYWVNLILIKHYNAGDDSEASFFHKYWVILQVILLPLYALVTYLLFKRSGYNFGEVLVFQLYMMSFLFIATATIQCLKLIFPHLQTRYIELPVLIIYAVITKVRFFSNMKRPVVILLGVGAITACFFLASAIQDFLIKVF